ncbi:MAG: SPFH domain-containing protein [Patescibacteria group bacterium]
MLVLLIKVVPWLVFLGGLIWGGLRIMAWYSEEERGSRGFRNDDAAKSKTLRPSLALPIVLILLGLISGIAFSTATEVAPTSVAVVENTLNGQFYQLDGGTHVWPFEPVLTPLMTKVYSYDLRRQIIEIGEPPAGAKPTPGLTATQAFGVASSSDSPGQPVVYFLARGWAFVNKDVIITLHRRYGADYVNSWVERQWVTTLKSIQGRRPYDYLKSNRVAFEDEVEKALQAQLVVDGKPLVNVSQLAIADYDYEPAVNKFLQDVAQKEFERQQAEQQILINTKKQEAAVIEIQTLFLTTKRAAEAQKEKLNAEAEGQAQAITSVTNAQADANKKLSASITTILVEYEKVRRWGGLWPMYYSGSETPFNLLFQASSPITSTVPATVTLPAK